ncbi:YqhR family membrane protein [Salirhabdus salicampi]|uniref:YqhR family membrane protein n=1 Tax=Salirhabdus salicampi TaxID=476102 RepID=UPI0020C2F0CA|nr:YqhR family membrane protein [Salirhabdus salicampi]MCP8616831.1 YqhR family membrane protein [Salirhabdus salicampi]
MGEKKLEQNQAEEPMTMFQRALLTGFVGGLLWGSLGSLAYYFNFTTISHASYILRSFFNASWVHGWMGELISIVIVSMLSILAAIVYYVVLKKRRGMIPGILYGIGIWVVFVYFLNPIFTAVPTFNNLNADTLVTTLCLHVLYGTFVGYTISYDYYNAMHKTT